MLEGVMANDDIGSGVGNFFRFVNEFDAELSDFCFQQRRDVATDFSPALELREVPSVADAIFKNSRVSGNVRLKFSRAQFANPRQRLRRNGTFVQMIFRARIARINISRIVFGHKFKTLALQHFRLLSSGVPDRCNADRRSVVVNLINNPIRRKRNFTNIVAI